MTTMTVRQHHALENSSGGIRRADEQAGAVADDGGIEPLPSTVSR